MPKCQLLKPQQIVTLFRQIDVLTVNGKTLAQACKEVGTAEQSYYRWRKILGGMQVDRAKRFKVIEQENVRLKKLVTDLSIREVSLKEARVIVREWVKRYNEIRPHKSLGYKPPAPQSRVPRFIQKQAVSVQ